MAWARFTSLSRRNVIAGGTAVLAASASARARDASSLFRDVETYEAFGDHRTGSPADAATAQWIADRLNKAGLRADLQLLPASSFRRFNFERAALLASGHAVDLFPIWPAAATPEAGLRGPLVDTGANAPALLADAIALVQLPYAANASVLNPVYRAPLATVAARNPLAIVAVTHGPADEIIALNSELDRSDWTMPVAIAAGRDLDRLRTRAGEEAVLHIAGAFDPSATASNVIAQRSGKGRPLVVSTPASGWFRCGNERGSGVALFLALAEWAASALPNPLVFAATTGHEFEGLGSRRLFDAALPAPDDTALWLHLGANLAGREVRFQNGLPVATNDAVTTRYSGASTEMLDPAKRAFAGVQGYDTPFDIDTRPAPGDLALYRDKGYRRIVGLVGAHPLHHTRLDRAQLTVAPGELTRIFDALKTLVALALG